MNMFRSYPVFSVSARVDCLDDGMTNQYVHSVLRLPWCCDAPLQWKYEDLESVAGSPRVNIVSASRVQTQ